LAVSVMRLCFLRVKRKEWRADEAVIGSEGCVSLEKDVSKAKVAVVGSLKLGGIVAHTLDGRLRHVSGLKLP